MSSLTTYCSSKLINKTNILFSLTIYLKKYFPFLSLSSLSCLSGLPFLPLKFFFLIFFSLFFSSPLGRFSLLLFSSFFFFLSVLILCSMLFFFSSSFSSLFSLVLFPFHWWIVVVDVCGSRLRFGLILVDLVGFVFVIEF